MVNVISSCRQLKRSDNFHLASRSLRNTLNNIGSRLDTCGIPDSNVRKPVQTLLTFTFCFLPLRYEYMKVIVFRLKSHACSFAISRSCGIQLDVPDKSMRTVPTGNFSLSAFFQFSINLIKTWLVLFFFCTRPYILIEMDL